MAGLPGSRVATGPVGPLGRPAQTMAAAATRTITSTPIAPAAAARGRGGALPEPGVVSVRSFVEPGWDRPC